jgi:hypothetical protein
MAKPIKAMQTIPIPKTVSKKFIAAFPAFAMRQSLVSRGSIDVTRLCVV